MPIRFHSHSYHLFREYDSGNCIRDVGHWQRSRSYRPSRPGHFRWIQPYRQALGIWSLIAVFTVDSVRPDTAQVYRNEEEAGKAVRESGLARNEIFITTKYSGLNGLDIETSIQNSLKNVSTASLGSSLCYGSQRSHTTLPIAWG